MFTIPFEPGLRNGLTISKLMALITSDDRDNSLSGGAGDDTLQSLGGIDQPGRERQPGEGGWT